MGKEFVNFKKLKSQHKKDISSVDTGGQNSIVTASGDGIICFWDVFNGELIKKVQAPQIGQKSNPVCSIRHASETSNQYLLVVYAEGEILCLDTIREQFIRVKDDRIIVRVNKMSMVDVQR